MSFKINITGFLLPNISVYFEGQILEIGWAENPRFFTFFPWLRTFWWAMEAANHILLPTDVPLNVWISCCDSEARYWGQQQRLQFSNFGPRPMSTLYIDWRTNSTSLAVSKKGNNSLQLVSIWKLMKDDLGSNISFANKAGINLEQNSNENLRPNLETKEKPLKILKWIIFWDQDFGTWKLCFSDFWTYHLHYTVSQNDQKSLIQQCERSEPS